MEEYTSMMIRVSNLVNTEKVFEEVKKYLSDGNKWVLRLRNDLEADYEEGHIIVDYSCSIGCLEFETLIPQMVKTLAKNNRDIEFDGNAHFTSCNCYYEHDICFEYRDGKLKINSLLAEDPICCPDCEEWVSEGYDYEEGKIYYCPVCGKEISSNTMPEHSFPKVKKGEFHF